MNGLKKNVNKRYQYILKIVDKIKLLTQCRVKMDVDFYKVY